MAFTLTTRQSTLLKVLRSQNILPCGPWTPGRPTPRGPVPDIEMLGSQNVLIMDLWLLEDLPSLGGPGDPSNWPPRRSTAEGQVVPVIEMLGSQNVLFVGLRLQEILDLLQKDHSV